ncbi:hypothetical protein AJ80_09757 [Polytolypa hystricis UAMH7299]|uniref:Uncharacterized protein n=1 Tax=Polytolypa hystricis (strain UAMH7299) TaxID=1447883 RepID=A0A2B7WK25_POLH7|nr:hypothetical protein AJ80_09757 [Polytolypa hystricis UAMH7299]
MFHQPEPNDVEMSEPVPPEEPEEPEEPEKPSQPPHLHFENLPVEIHEAVLDHLFGVRASTLSSISPPKSNSSSWNKALRHPRRKALSDLALVSPAWRRLVQERIYRHIRMEGTTDAFQDCADWFAIHSHLAPYVRHIEIWIPVLGDRTPKMHPLHRTRRDTGNDAASLSDITLPRQSTDSSSDSASSSGAAGGVLAAGGRNATLQQIFYHISCFFPDARILTLEVCHCKKPPMIRYFDSDPWGQSDQEHLEVLPKIHTFVMEGAWNVMRDYQHWRTLSRALPNLREWQCAYAKPKLESLATISRILTNMPKQLTRLNISLEGFYSKSGAQMHWFDAPQSDQHLCRLLGEIAPQLESLTFTGKVCATLFTNIRAETLRSGSKSRLKSINLAVKACCREARNEDGSPILNELSGVTNMNFINAFERMILAAVRSLDALTAIEYMRIRFIDLDSACGLLNPYFQLVGDKCSGLWSETILETLHTAHPTARFEELSDGILPQYGINSQTGTRLFPRTLPRSIKASMYKIIADKSKT